MTGTFARLALCLAACTACVGSAGCAGLGLPGSSAERPGPGRMTTGPSPTPQAAMEMIVIGKSSKADVFTSLGKATVISFDSGYEVWVYRWSSVSDKATRAASELVVLFDPSGLATKVRVRPGYATPS